jgi:hypothetical protein
MPNMFLIGNKVNFMIVCFSPAGSWDFLGFQKNSIIKSFVGRSFLPRQTGRPLVLQLVCTPLDNKKKGESLDLSQGNLGF